MGHRIGDVLELADDGFYVYGLLDDNGTCFYIGVSNDPWRRLREHSRSFSNARVKAKMARVAAKRLVVLCDPTTELEALKLEKELIGCLKGLLNQEHRRDYRTEHKRHPVFEKYLRSASSG